MHVLHFIFATLLCAASPSLTIEVVPAGKLPKPLTATAAVQDSAGNIFVLGGLGNHEPNNAVLRYDLETETFENVGSFPHDTVYSGAAHAELNGDIYYIGGVTIDSGFGTYASDIWKLDAQNPTPVTVSHLPQGLASHCTVYAPFVGVFTMGGSNLTDYEDKFYFYDSKANETIINAPLNPVLRVGAPCIGYGVNSYIFGGWNSFLPPNYFNTILKSSPISETVETLNTTLPVPLYSASAVVVEDSAYIIGGETGGLAVRHYLTRFDIPAEGVTQIELPGMKPGLIEASSVYIPSLHRIYVFGGYEAFSGFQDDVFYIQLD